mmetsp:Transcript_7791/g.28508  ORF Transcript_7791/g.28508 Transcript_7791/m.28508 type:complete len:256 (-) Transcript_7791:87-854(-)
MVHIVGDVVGGELSGSFLSQSVQSEMSFIYSITPNPSGASEMVKGMSSGMSSVMSSAKASNLEKNEMRMQRISESSYTSDSSEPENVPMDEHAKPTPPRFAAKAATAGKMLPPRLLPVEATSPSSESAPPPRSDHEMMDDEGPAPLTPRSMAVELMSGPSTPRCPTTPRSRAGQFQTCGAATSSASLARPRSAVNSRGQAKQPPNSESGFMGWLFQGCTSAATTTLGEHAVGRFTGDMVGYDSSDDEGQVPKMAI